MCASEWVGTITTHTKYPLKIIMLSVVTVKVVFNYVLYELIKIKLKLKLQSQTSQ